MNSVELSWGYGDLPPASKQIELSTRCYSSAGYEQWLVSYLHTLTSDATIVWLNQRQLLPRKLLHSEPDEL